MSRILCVLCIKSAFLLLLLFLSLPTHLPVSLSKDSKFVKTFSLAFFPPPFFISFSKKSLTHSRQDISGDETSSCIKIYTGSHGIKSESFVTWSQIFRTEGKKIEISCRALSFFFLLTRNSTRTRWRRFFFFFLSFFIGKNFGFVPNRISRSNTSINSPSSNSRGYY